MSKLSKFLRSDTGGAVKDLAKDAAIAYAKKQSSDVRKVAAIVEPVLATYEAVKDSGSTDPLRDTIYATAATGLLEKSQNTGVTMPEQTQIQIAPVKSGSTTSTFIAAAWVVAITPFLPILLKIAENWVGTLPANSWLAFVMPGVISTGYGIVRFLTTNGARQATAQLATAQAISADAQARIATAEAAPAFAPTAKVATLGYVPDTAIESVSLADMEEAHAAPSE